MNSENMRTYILDAAKRIGLDLIGFASPDRFEGVPAQNNPLSIFPEAKTVIMLGKRICRGALRGVEEGSNFGDYSLFGKNWLEDEFLSIACYDLVNAIEDQGYEACPIFPNPSEIRPSGVSVAEGRPEPNVFPDFDYAAVACGLGEIGFNGIFMSKKFGTRQRFHMILTDAEIEPTPIFEGSVCDRCGKCAASCPLGAIDTENTSEIEICGKRMTVASINYDICRTCQNGACPNRFAAYARPDRIAALCNRTCLSHLEEREALDNKFEMPFRQRDAWAIGGNVGLGRDTEKMNVLGGVFSKDGNRGNRK